MTIYQIYSLGQIVQSDIKKSVAAFSKILQVDKSYSPAFAYASVYFTFALDKYWYGNIDSFKAGRITSEVFISKLADQFDIKNDYRIIDSWNSMCEIDVVRKKELVNLFTRLSKGEVELVIVAVTNPLQYEYIAKNLGLMLEENGLPGLGSNPAVKVITSFLNGNLFKVSLTKEVIALNSMDNKGNKICSKHEEFTLETLDIKYAQFEQEDCLGMLEKGSEL